jgi:hypothetical protein
MGFLGSEANSHVHNFLVCPSALARADPECAPPTTCMTLGGTGQHIHLGFELLMSMFCPCQKCQEQ